MSKVTEYVCKLIVLPQNAKILDCGCKNASTLRYFKSVFGNRCDKLVGIDKRSINFEIAKTLKGTNIELIEMDVSKGIDFEDNSFDFIFHKDTMECISEKTAHIEELYRVLSTNGIIVCIHADWESIVFNCQNKQLMNKAIYSYANWQQLWMDDFDSWIGRRIWAHFNKTLLFNGKYLCFSDIETEYKEGMHGYNFIHSLDCLHKEAGLLSEKEYFELLSDVETTYKNGEYMFSMPYYIYIGNKIC